MFTRKQKMNHPIRVELDLHKYSTPLGSTFVSCCHHQLERKLNQTYWNVAEWYQVMPFNESFPNSCTFILMMMIHRHHSPIYFNLVSTFAYIFSGPSFESESESSPLSRHHSGGFDLIDKMGILTRDDGLRHFFLSFIAFLVYFFSCSSRLENYLN